MGWFDSFFGDKKTQTNNSTQSGTSSFGLTPAVQDYWSSISGMFGPNTWNPVGPNQYQTQAAGTQAGLGASLMPAYGAAGGIASGGINEGDISRFMNPYTQNVIDTTLGTMRRSDAIANAGSQGQAAKLGALSGTNPIVARNLNEDAQARARNSTMAQLQNQNYAQAAEMAKASTNAQLSGIGAMNSTVGNMAGINQGLFGMGSQFYNQQFQNQMMPYQLAQMGTQTLAGLSPFSGTSSTGSSTGTSTTTGTSSPFSVLSNLAGLGISAYGAGMFSDERVKENIHPIGETYDGQPIYKYNYKGEPTTQIGLMAQDVEQHTPEAVGSIAGIKTVNYDKATKGAERSMADGGGVGMEPFKSDSHERFVKAFDTISGLMTRARGGQVGKADGGTIGSWETTATPAPDYKAFGDKLQKMGQPAPMGNDDGGLAAAQASLSSFMSNMRPRYDSGGAVEWGETGPVFPVSGLEPPSFLGAGSAPGSRSALPPPRTSNVPMTDDDLYGAIKGFEGFNPRAYGDYKQHSVGYGTRATSPNEVITQEEADRRLRDEVSRARTIVDKFAPNLDPGTRAALTSLTFNAGDDWTRAGLGDAIRSGNMGDARSRFLQYTKAGGQDLPGLVNRRQAEAAWIGGAAPPSDDSPEGARLAASMRPQQAPVSSGEVMLASGRGTVPTGAAPERDSWLTRMLPGLKEGIWAGKPATPEQRFGTALMNIRGPMFEGPLNGVARNVMEWEQGRQRERQIDAQVAQLVGQVGGQPTMEARRLALEAAKNPEEIKRIQAMTKAAELQTDKAYQLEVARATAEMQKDVARADLEQRAGMMERLFPSNQPPAAGSSTRMRWVPTPPQQTQIPAPPPQTAPVLRSAPQQAPQQMQRQSAEPPPDSPAARSAIRRSEASDKLRSRQTERKTEQATIQTQFNADAASLQPMEFVRKYSDRRGDLTVDQIRKLDAMIDRLSRGTP